MATKYYGINDKWTDDDLANVIEVASEDGTVSSVKVNGEEYGGGGEWTTATVLLTTSGEDLNDYDLSIPYHREDDEGTSSSVYLGDGPFNNLALLVPLYDGKAFASYLGPTEGVSFNGTGLVNSSGYGTFIITGDGTITITA